MRTYRHEIGVGLYVIVYLATLAFVSPGGGGFLSGLNNVLYFGMGAVTIWSQLQAARRAGTDRRTRRGWHLLAASGACIVLSGIVWTVLLAVDKTLAPLATLVLETTYIPLAIAAFLAFPVNPGFSLRDRRTCWTRRSAPSAPWRCPGTSVSSRCFRLPPEVVAAGRDSDRGSVGGGVRRIPGAAARREQQHPVGGRPGARRPPGLHPHQLLLEPGRGDLRAGPLGGRPLVLRLGASLGRRAAGAARGVAAPAVEAAESRQMGPSLFVVGAYCLLLLALVNDRSGSAIDIALAATAMTTLLLIRQRVGLWKTAA